MVTVSIIIVLSSIGIPIYKGYILDSKIGLAKQNLNNIYLAQTNYLFQNNKYYLSGTTCGDHNLLIKEELFYNQNILENQSFKFCIINFNDGYKAIVSILDDEIKLSIDHLKNITTESN